ncbi:uncharacterized protein [Hemitrygon akajei]|uniref:uncharacterized protein n=1 Tax=Hemitrygon akajei TaxID=2704970 RepID=UPI003BF95804
MARLKGPNWADELPWVLLGIHTALREDLRTSSVELVYGTPLVVPGEFIPAPRGQEEEPAAVLSRLRERLGNLAPIPASQHGQNPTCVPKDLRNCKFVFVRQGGHRAPLLRPDKGPFNVIRNNGSTFVLDIGGREEVFSVDQLKPAHVDVAQLVEIPASRRRGRPPKQGPAQTVDIGGCIAGSGGWGMWRPTSQRTRTCSQSGALRPVPKRAPSLLGKSPRVGRDCEYAPPTAFPRGTGL